MIAGSVASATGTAPTWYAVQPPSHTGRGGHTPRRSVSYGIRQRRGGIQGYNDCHWLDSLRMTIAAYQVYKSPV